MIEIKKELIKVLLEKVKNGVKLLESHELDSKEYGMIVMNLLNTIQAIYEYEQQIKYDEEMQENTDNETEVK